MIKTIILFVMCAAFAGPSTPVADKIIAFSLDHMKKKIARGECWDLAEAALNASGAKWESPYGYGTKIDYKTQPMLPADILQFSNIKFEMPNGTMSFPQHTAIVYKANKHIVTVFHQNFNNRRYVDTLTMNLDYIESGKLEAFRPVGN